MNINDLGKWGLLDIETTGISAQNDHIIDIGFLTFDGLKLEKKFSSLVRTDHNISGFIQKLTGISPDQVMKAPHIDKVLTDVYELEGYKLIAHNSDFESGFLGSYFDEDPFVDSMPFLAMMNMGKARLNLESFITSFGIADKEDHRGYEDSLNLLKVYLMNVELVRLDTEKYFVIQSVLMEHYSNHLLTKIFNLESAYIYDLADQIDFDLKGHLKNYLAKNQEESESIDPAQIDFNSKGLSGFFQDEDKIKEVFPRYEMRDSQLKMALRVGQSFGNKVHSIIQAPTGTGKTMAYLVPSFTFSRVSGEKVLLTTGTKSLQKQLADKDIPMMKKLLGDDIKVTKIIGSKNHMCELLFRSKFDSGRMLLGEDEIFTRAYFDLFFQLNSEDEYFNKENVPFVFKLKSKNFEETMTDISVDYRACAGSNCIYHKQCSYIQTLRQAQEADLIISNHAMTFSWPKSLERPSYVVVDEAHKLESELTSAFSIDIAEKDLQVFYKNLSQYIGAMIYILTVHEYDEGKVDFLRNLIQPKQAKLEDLLLALNNLIELYFQKSPRYTSEYWNELPYISNNDPVCKKIFHEVHELHEFFIDLFTPLNRFYEHIVDNYDEKEHAETLTIITKNHEVLKDYINSLELLETKDTDYSGALKYHEDHGFILNVSPIDVGKCSYDNLLSLSESVVFTSATMANADGSNGTAMTYWSTGYNYLDQKKRFQTGLFLDPVYDYEKNGQVFLASDVEGINAPGYVEDTLAEVCKVIDHLEGKTLLLYSSRRRFELAVDLLIKRYDGHIPLFIQGTGNNIVDSFKEQQNGILVGMESLSEGIDIPGDALQFIYVDKIPDLRMDFIIKKRRDFFDSAFGNEFKDYFLATRARALHQKLGRLIRTKDDKGCVLITDGRTKRWKKNTLSSFNELMKPYHIQNISMDEASTKIIDCFRNTF